MDRAGLVGDDGPTHHGAFDVSYFRALPNVVVMAPRDEAMLIPLLRTALAHDEGPVAFRYPRGTAEGVPLPARAREIPIGTGEVLREGERVALLGYGYGVRVRRSTRPRSSPSATSRSTVADGRFAKPLDERLIERLGADHELVVTIEENVLAGGFGSGVLEHLEDAFADSGHDHARVLRLRLPTATSPTASRRSCGRRSGSPARRWPTGDRGARRPGSGRGVALPRSAACDRDHTQIAHTFVPWMTL